MLLQIIQHTPLWVFGLFALLLWVGAKQLSTRTASLTRILAMGTGMTGLSVYGALSAFSHQTLALAVWVLVAVAAYAWMFGRPLARGTRFDTWQGVFTIPGSWQPLALIMGVFATKYVVGVMLAMQPTLASQAAFALPVAALYGVFSGVFASKTVRMWRLAMRSERMGGALSI